MAKRLILILLLTLKVSADFTTNCVACHAKKKVDLRKTFMNALLVYGGEKNFKIALFYYCKNPNITSSVMSEDFLKKYLPLKPIQVDDIQLKNDINEYWKRYKIKDNLK